ncbi:unnamed protein product [Arabidopsis lyrata]|nr:unnamed protein product [Arabidopsis lyrata]
MWTNKFFFLLPVVCIAVFATAQPLPSPQPSQIDCWSSIEVIPDCVPEIFRSITNGQFGDVGPSCCHAFWVSMLIASLRCLSSLHSSLLPADSGIIVPRQ